MSAKERSHITAFIVLDVDKNTTWIDVSKHVMQKKHLGRFARDDPRHGTRHAMYLEQLSSYGCPSWAGSLEFTALEPPKRQSLVDVHYWCETLHSRMSARMKYWSTIAKTTHCWRDRYKAVYTQWVQAFDVVKTDKYAKKCRHSRSADAGGISRAERRETRHHCGQRASERATHQPSGS